MQPDYYFTTRNSRRVKLMLFRGQYLTGREIAALAPKHHYVTADSVKARFARGLREEELIAYVPDPSQHGKRAGKAAKQAAIDRGQVFTITPSRRRDDD